jgi:hypothetical protein
MTNSPPFLYQIMLTVAFSCLTLFANAQNAEEARQRNNAANEAASRAQYDRNKAISTGRGAPNPLQGVVDEQERQQADRKAKEKAEYQEKKGKEAKELAKFKEEYAKNAGQRAIEARVYSDQRAQEDAFIDAFITAGLIKCEAYNLAHSKGYSESIDKLREINRKLDYLKENIASANFEALDTTLRQLILAKAPLIALKYIYQLDRFTAKEAEIDALKLNALFKIFKENYIVNAYFGDKAYNNSMPIYENNELKLLELYFALEDKYPDTFSTMMKLANNSWYGTPYERINSYYNWYNYERNFGKEPSMKIKNQGKKFAKKYFARYRAKSGK